MSASGWLAAGIGLAIGAAIRAAIKRQRDDVGRFVRNRGGYQLRTDRNSWLDSNFDPAVPAWGLPRRGVLVTLQQLGTHVEVWAQALVPPGARVLVRRGWEARPPALTAALVDLPVVVERDEVRAQSDQPTLQPLLAAARLDVPRAMVASDRGEVLAYLTGTITSTALESVVDLVVDLARFDDALTDTLLALPGATLLEGHAVDPGVILEPDGVIVGVRRGASVAQAEHAGGGDEIPADVAAIAARAGDGELVVGDQAARFTWRGVERDPARLRAAVDALRALRARGPYR